MVAQYLQDEGFNAAAMTLLDEANVKRQQQARTRALLSQMKKFILGMLSHLWCVRRLGSHSASEGNWEEVDALCAKHMFRNKKSFLYAVTKQQYLELVEKTDNQAVRGSLPVSVICCGYNVQ